jgi:hypothetical protein
VSDPRELAKLLRRMFGSASGARILPVTNILDQSADALERLASIEQARAADMSELAKRAAMIDVAKICERLMVAEHDRDAFDSARVALVAENDGLCARIAELEAALSKWPCPQRCYMLEPNIDCEVCDDTGLNPIAAEALKEKT